MSPWMIAAALSAPASASGVLYGPDGYAELLALDGQAQVFGRVGVVEQSFRFEAPPGDWTFAASLPEGAAVAGLRFREGDGAWITAAPGEAVDPADTPDGAPGELLPGQVFTAALPTTAGEAVEVALSWQQLLPAEAGALALTLPLDDGGVSPAAAVSLGFEVTGLDEVLEASLSVGGDVALDGVSASATWTGAMSDADAVRLTWVEAAAPLGVTLLAYRPAEDPFTGALGGPGYALAVIQPGPLTDADRVEQLFTFVLDVSRSMVGAPLEAAVAAGSSWIDDLEAQDRFNVIPYASQPYPFRARATGATGEAAAEAGAFLDEQEAAGLSDPEEALVTALGLVDDTLLQRTFFGCSGTTRGEDGDAPPVEGAPIEQLDGAIQRVAPYVVLLTDGGASTGETDLEAILEAVASANTAGASLFAVGVGEDVDRELLERLTAAHRGEVAFAEDADAVEAAVSSLQERIRDPLLVQPQVDVEGAYDAAPEALPDAGAGWELLVAFRYDEPGGAELLLTGVRGQEELALSDTLSLPEEDGRWPVVARAWAQLRVDDLDDRYLAGESVYDEIAELVEDYGVASEVVTLSFGGADASEDVGAMAYASSGCAVLSRVSPRSRSLWATLLLGLGVALLRRR